MTFIVSLGMAESASAYPLAGAQYYWSFTVSNEKHRPFAAYVYVVSAAGPIMSLISSIEPAG